MSAEARYRATQDKLQMFVGLVLGMFDDGELEDMLVQISKAHALAPILDPTLYSRGLSAMRVVEADARALARLRNDLHGRHPQSCHCGRPDREGVAHRTHECVQIGPQVGAQNEPAS